MLTKFFFIVRFGLLEETHHVPYQIIYEKDLSWKVYTISNFMREMLRNPMYRLEIINSVLYLINIASERDLKLNRINI